MARPTPGRKRIANPLSIDGILQKLDWFSAQGIGEAHPEYQHYFRMLYRADELPEDSKPIAPGTRVNASERYSYETIGDLHGTLVSDLKGAPLDRELAGSALGPPEVDLTRRLTKRLRKFERTQIKGFRSVMDDPWKRVFFMAAALQLPGVRREYGIPEWIASNIRNQGQATLLFMVPTWEQTVAACNDRGVVHAGSIVYLASMIPMMTGRSDHLHVPTDRLGWPVGRPYDQLADVMVKYFLYQPIKGPTRPLRNTLREAVYRGMAKAMAMRDVHIFAIVLRKNPTPSIYRERFKLAMESIEIGLRDHAYGAKGDKA